MRGTDRNIVYMALLWKQIVCVTSIPTLVSVNGALHSTLDSQESSIENDSSPVSATNLPRTSTSSNDLLESCCFRESREIVAGYDDDKEAVYVDVGHCRKDCRTNTPRPIIPGDERDRLHRACPRHHKCYPSRTRVERFHLLGGPTTHEVVEDCHCQATPRKCSRHEVLKVFNPNSPFQTEVDVGRCHGKCHDENGCQPTRNKTVAIPGPNGDTIVEVVAECGCVGNCYRMSHKEIYYERFYNATLESHQERLIEIDVGACAGNCSGAEKYQCVLRSKTTPSFCLMSLVKKQTTCAPISYISHKFTTTHNEERTILTVNECGCQ